MNTQQKSETVLTEVIDEQHSSRIELMRAAWDRLFGYDFFISYAWKDGRKYAENLFKTLASKPHRYRCFIDSKEMGGGAEWRRSVRKALSKSKVLLLIGSEHGLTRDAVYEEVHEFSKSRRPLIPIDLSGRIATLPSDHRLYPLLEQRLRIDETAGDFALSSGKPSQDVVEYCNSSFGFVKIDRVRTLVLRTIITTLTILALWAFSASIQARNQRTNALKRLSENLVTQGKVFADDSKDADAMLMFTEAMRVEPNPDRIEKVHRWRVSAWADRVAVPQHAFIPGGAVIATYFNADGRSLVIGTEEGKATVWNVEGGKTVFDKSIEFNLLLNVPALAFDQRDGLLATGNGANLEVWDISSGERRYGPFRNDAEIVALDLDPNGRFAVSTTKVEEPYTSRCYKWGLATGEKIELAYSSDEAILQGVRVSPNGNLILGWSSSDEIVRIWDAKSGKRLLDPGIKGEGSYYFYHAAFSPEETRVITGGYCNSACIWAVSSGQLLVGPLSHGKDRDGADTVQYMAFSPDGKRVATAGNDDTVRVWNAVTGDPLASPIKHGKFAKQISFSPDTEGKWLLTGSQDETARVWEADSGRPVTPPLIHRGFVDAVAFSPDGSRVVTGSRDGIVRIWEITSPPVSVAPQKHNHEVIQTSFSRDGKLVLSGASGGKNGSVSLWVLANGQWKPIAVPSEQTLIYAGFSQDQQQILTISGEGTFQTWNLDGKAMHKSIEMDAVGARVTSGSFTTSGKRVVIGRSDGTAQVYDQDGNKILPPCIHEQRPNDDNSITYTGFSPCERYVITLAHDGYARIWDCDNDGKLFRTLLHEKNASLNFAAFDDSGQYLVTVGGDTAKVWNWKTGDAIGKKLTHETGFLWRAAFTPDGKRVITAGSEGIARIWDTQTSEPIGGPLTHKGIVRVAQFSSDGSRVLTASEDGAVRLWDAESGLVITPEYRHSGGIWSGDMSHDGLSIAIGGKDGVVRIWKLSRESRRIDTLRDQYSFAACRRVDAQGGLDLLSPTEVKELAVKLYAGNNPVR